MPTPPGLGQFELKHDPVTVARMDGVNGTYSLLFGQAQGTEGPYNQGTYLWVRVPNWPVWEERIIRGPYIHHAAIVLEHVAPALYDACRYIPGLEPDPTEPTRAQLDSWFRGDIQKL